MEFATFEKLVSLLEEEEKRVGELYDRGLDLINFLDPYHEMIGILIIEIYGKSGYDWFSWFCHENDFGKKGLGAWDENEAPICYDVKSLWELLEEDKIKNKI